VILGLPTAAQVGSAVCKPIHKPKVDFYDPFSLFISDLYGFSSFPASLQEIAMTQTEHTSDLQ